MTNVHLTLNNFNDSEALLQILPDSNIYEFTTKKVLRRKERIICSCGFQTVHNGHNLIQKKGFGMVKIGKQKCQNCGKQYAEDKGFWQNLLGQWKENITTMVFVLRDSSVAWRVISKIMTFVIPCSKDKVLHLFNQAIEPFEYAQENYLIVNYDEQHPKRGRQQKFRLTLLNYHTRVPIADELFDSKDSKTIEAFLRKHLDVTKELVIITDCDRRYPGIFKKIWGKKVIHQKCLLHLNKLVSKDFGKNMTLQNMYNKYLILNIFYNRKKELRFIEKLLKRFDKKTFSSTEVKKKWLKEVKQKFRDYVRELENERRREKKNLTQRKLKGAKKVFDKLLAQKALFPKKAQERLKMIKNNWKYFTAFYEVKDCPATNNAIENFYSTSLKTHRKKQLRTNRGIENHMKLTAFKRVEGFKEPKKTLIEIFSLIRLVTT